MPTDHGNRVEFLELLRSYDSTILTTRGADGHFHARPMAMQREHLSSNEIWFATVADSQKVKDLQSDPHCCLAFCASQHAPTYLSVSGDAEVVRDHEMIEHFWEPSWRAWFPKGPDEADIVLIRFRPEHAEYVHPETGRLRVLFTMVRNIFTGTRVEPAPKKQLDLQ
jgi:general stress protein 26